VLLPDVGQIHIESVFHELLVKS